MTRRLLAVRCLALVAVVLTATGARAQAMATSGACPPGASADECYRQGLELARRALSPRVVDESGVREALRVLLGACERQVGDACYVAGRITAADTAAVNNRAALTSAAGRAARLFARGCYASERPSPPACNALGFASSYAPDAAKPDSALHHLDRGCESGNPTACVRAALLMDDWPAGTAPTRPAQLAARACDGGSPGGCVQVARRTSTRLARVPFSRRATPAFDAERQSVRARLREACGRGLATACTELGATFLPDHPVFGAGPDSAAFYLEMACSGEGGLWAGQSPRLGDGAACALIGHTVLAQAVVPDSTLARRALAWFQRGCELVDSESCADLAWFGTQHDLVPLPLAQLRAVTACIENSGAGCRVAGWLYMRHEAQDLPRADQYLRRACLLDDAEACADAGLLAWEDDNMPDALKYYRRACALGSGDACYSYGRMVAPPDSSGVPADPSPAYLSMACEYGLADGCWMLAIRAHQAQDPVQEGEYRARACRGDAAYCKRKY